LLELGHSIPCLVKAAAFLLCPPIDMRAPRIGTKIISPLMTIRP
jgi:hypothetical protein